MFFHVPSCPRAFALPVPSARTLYSLVFPQDSVLCSQARLWYIRKKRVPPFQSSPLVSNYLCLSVYPLPTESVYESRDLLFWLLYAQHLAFSRYLTNICWIGEWVIKILSRGTCILCLALKFKKRNPKVGTPRTQSSKPAKWTKFSNQDFSAFERNLFVCMRVWLSKQIWNSFEGNRWFLWHRRSFLSC